jgi:hypothetical protein
LSTTEVNEMSDLRKQLDAAKNEYRSARYPGDLASELLAKTIAPAHSPMRLFIGVAATLAAAAAIGFLLLRPHSTMPVSPGNKPTIVAVAPTSQPSEEETDTMSLGELASLPEFPDGISVSTTDADAAASPATMASKQQADEEYIPMVPEPPSMTELGSMPSLPSMDFSFSDLSDTTTNQTSKEST